MVVEIDRSKVINNEVSCSMITGRLVLSFTSVSVPGRVAWNKTRRNVSNFENSLLILYLVSFAVAIRNKFPFPCYDFTLRQKCPFA